MSEGGLRWEHDSAQTLTKTNLYAGKVLPERCHKEDSQTVTEVSADKEVPRLPPLNTPKAARRTIRGIRFAYAKCDHTRFAYGYIV